ncbi:MAG: MDR family oxidoreductase [Verrucomicrobiota bacterium]
MKFLAWLLTRDPAGGDFAARLATLDDADLPPGGVRLRTLYSSLNYKDALALTNRGPVVRAWPMVPGIDLVGEVESSDDPVWRLGDRVIVTGRGLGETRWGGLSERVSVPADFPVRLPAGMTPETAMGLDTAGLTAMLCVLALEAAGLHRGLGDVLVTGASGGVGGVAVRVLARSGYRVVASTGRPDESGDYLRALGAAEVVDRALLSGPGKPLQKERWAAVVDCVGGWTLANACASTRRGGWVAACGLAQDMALPATVAPFILRGVSLLGIDSVEASAVSRAAAWARLAELIDEAAIKAMTRQIPLAEAPAAAVDLLDGKVRGRLVVRVGAAA